MKRKQNISILSSLLIAVFLVFAGSCKKDKSEPDNDTNEKTITPLTYGTLTDQDGNTYKTVTIGTQIWMAENLRTTKYNDSIPIPNVADGDQWEKLSTGAYCTYDNTESIETIATYGRLYNWYAVNTGKLAPKGWHVPSDADWKKLEMYLGISQEQADKTGWRGTDEGGKLKEIGIKHWESPNLMASNSSGFSALPGGYRGGDHGSFNHFGIFGNWWSVTEINAGDAWFRGLVSDYGTIYRDGSPKDSGFSVRCVSD